MTHYNTLGIDKDASPDDIKRAYRKKSMQHHPDRNQGNIDAEKQMAVINRAYEVLSNPESRQRYDATGDDNAATQAPQDMVDNQARANLLSLLDSLIERHDERQLCHTNIVQAMRQAITDARRNTKSNRSKIRTQMRKIRVARRRFKSDEFIFAGHFRQKAQGLFRSWKQARFELQVMARMEQLLEGAEYAHEAQQQSSYVVFTARTC